MKIGSLPPPTFQPRRLPSPGPAEPAPAEPRDLPVLPALSGALGSVAGAALAGSAGFVAGAVAGAAAGYVLQHVAAWLTPEGPRLIVGHVGADEALLWGRGDADTPYMFTEVRDGRGSLVARQTTLLRAEDGFTGTAAIAMLQPGSRYTCEVSYASSPDSGQREHQARGKFRTADPAAETTKFVMGSCNNHRLWRRNEAWARIHDVAERVQPDFLLHTGDQIYADQPLQTHSLDGYRGCYRRAWSSEEARALLKEYPNYMILDDHEVRNGFAQNESLSKVQQLWLRLRGMWGDEPSQRQALENNGLQAYAEFQDSHNPKSFGDDKKYYTFSRGPAEFFVLDTNTERDPDHGRLISDEQLAHLRDWLTSHPDKAKFVVSSVPFLAESSDPQQTEARWSSEKFRAQRDSVLEFIAEQELQGVVFLSGDSHNSFHMQTALPHGTVHELGASPVNGWFPRGREMYAAVHHDETPRGLPYQTSLDQEHFLGEKKFFHRDYSACMSVETDGKEVQFSIHRTHRDDPGGVYTSGKFPLRS
jgi:alkaline phosphatase D